MTMAKFVTLALQDELHSKLNIQEDKNMTQKEFVIGLIETEIERDLTQRAAVGEEQTESADVSDCENDFEEIEEEIDEQENNDFEGDFDDESDDVDEELYEDESESEDMSMSMGM